jgi:type II secretory pathway pseudopilin PulG
MEYALLIAVVIGVFSAMQLYTRRSLQARIKSGADNIHTSVLSGGDAANLSDTLFGSNTQYEPYYMAQGSSSYKTTSSEGNETGVTSGTGGNRELAGSVFQREGNQTITSTEDAD